MRVRPRITRDTVAAISAFTLSAGAMSGLGIAAITTTWISTTAASIPCSQLPGTPEPFEGKSHIQYDGQWHPPYRTVPPTSGWHTPRLMAPGIYTGQVPEELQVHFLEHGHIMINYAPDTPAAQIQELSVYARHHLRDVALAPYPKLTHGLALTGWQRLERLDTVDMTAVDRFVSTVAGRYDHGWQGDAVPCI